MFKKNTSDDYFRGLGEGKATVFSMIKEIIESHENCDPISVLMAIEIICEYELLDNPYRGNVVLFKSKPREI